jgi:uncharacterized membrane protein HdeD (DUF308 family)
MKNMKLIASVITIPLGILLFVYGGYDDSPGAQLLGLLAIIGGVVGLIRLRNNKESK